MIKLGIVGCGAVTKRLHLPALSTVSEMTVQALVDVREDRAQTLAAAYKVPYWSSDYHTLIGRVDVALIALPNAMHASVSVALLNEGMHVLCEKPMALTATECDQMIAAAEKTQTVLGVALVRRFYPSMMAVKRLLDARCLGEIQRFDFQEGAPYGWSPSTDAPFSRSMAGGGVLIDIGAHTLDLLLWWLGEWASVEYADDNLGGVEANCRLWIRLHSGAEGEVRLSRTHLLKNVLRIEGDHGWIEVGPNSYTKLKCFIPELLGPHQLEIDVGSNESVTWRGEPNLLTYIADEHRDFLRAIEGHGHPWVTGREGKRSVVLIEECYRQGGKLSMPWIEYVPLDRVRV